MSFVDGWMKALLDLKSLSQNLQNPQNQFAEVKKGIFEDIDNIELRKSILHKAQNEPIEPDDLYNYWRSICPGLVDTCNQQCPDREIAAVACGKYQEQPTT